MHLNSCLTLFALPVSVLAFNITGLPYEPPGPDDLRSACPGLNTLANHAVIPRSGRSISVEAVVKGVKEAYNISPVVTLPTLLISLLVLGKPIYQPFDITDFDVHGVLEHDASLSRADKSNSDDATVFNKTIFKEFMSGFETIAPFDVGAAINTRDQRVKNAQLVNKKNLNFHYGLIQALQSLGETAMYMSALAGSEEGYVTTRFVTTFFEQERFPLEEGWQPPRNETGVREFGELFMKLARLTTDDILKDFFEAVITIIQLLNR